MVSITEGSIIGIAEVLFYMQDDALLLIHIAVHSI